MSESTATGPVKVLYTAEATVTGGRQGHGRTSDGSLEVDLVSPAELGGGGAPGTNPEQLFALGYAACFQNAHKRCPYSNAVRGNIEVAITVR